MNEPMTNAVRSVQVRSGSAFGRPPQRVDLEADSAPNPRLLDWVPAAEPRRPSAHDYPIEAGVPHPHWVRDPAERPLAAPPVVIRDSPVVVRLLVGLAVAAFLLGMTVFYPVSPLGS
jgi:hypothetical protein